MTRHNRLRELEAASSRQHDGHPEEYCLACLGPGGYRRIVDRVRASIAAASHVTGLRRVGGVGGLAHGLRHRPALIGALVSRRARLARLEAALLVDTGDLCLKCTELANPEEFRRRMRAMVERAKTNPEPRQVLNSEKLAAHFAELRRLTAPCP